MITTEENILYQLLSSIRSSELINDEVIDEREIRSMMRVHRNELIYKYSNKGVDIQDICFQMLPIINLSVLNANEYIASLPNIVQLPHNLGTYLQTLEFGNIPILSSETYELSKRNLIDKYQPKATIQNQQLKVYINGVSPQAIANGTRVNSRNASIMTKQVQMRAVLDNPDDGYNYDWTTSQYPLPNEIVNELKVNLLKRDFNIILSSKSDQVPNMKNDTLRYHDQGQVQR